MEDYSKQRNKATTQRGYWGIINHSSIPIMGRMKARDVKPPDIAALMKKLAYKPAEANCTFGVLCKMIHLAKCGACGRTPPSGTSRCSRPARQPVWKWYTSSAT